MNYTRWLFRVDDDSKIYDFVREKGKMTVEDIDLDYLPPSVDDGFRYKT